MAKIKVHELAKELGKESKDVIAFLEANGIEAKAMSGIEEDMAAKVRSNFGAANAEKKAESKKADAPKAHADKDGNPVKKARPVDKDGNPVKKKKNVFVVTRDRDDRRRRGSDSSRNENRDNNGQKKAPVQQAQPRGPIRPRSFADGVRPSQRASAYLPQRDPCP